MSAYSRRRQAQFAALFWLSFVSGNSLAAEALQPASAADGAPQPQRPVSDAEPWAVGEQAATAEPARVPVKNDAAEPARVPVKNDAAAPASAAASQGHLVQMADERMKLAVLPLEFTAFGDFYYEFSKPRADDFHIGAVELDAALHLTDFVLVSTAVAYGGDEDGFGLGAFVIDCGLFGQGQGFPIANKTVRKSGLAFGKFDVPIGIAYLEYPAVANRLVTQPQAVLATHGAWNDIGGQVYALAEHWSALGYVVNGLEVPADEGATLPARTALGGRLSAKTGDLFELGASGAATLAGSSESMLFGGADLTTRLGPLDLRSEYLLKHAAVAGAADDTHGVYVRSLLNVQPVFLMARYDTAFTNFATLDRRVSGGGAVEVFPEGEVRAILEQSIDTSERTVTLQLVGGSTFQPTGFRR